MNADPQVINFDLLTADYRRRTEAALEANLPAASTTPEKLHEAMRYAVLGNGKRVRPLLVYGAGNFAARTLPTWTARRSRWN